MGHPDDNKLALRTERVRRLWIDTLPERSREPSDDAEVCVMVPLGPKDVEIAPLAVEGVQRFLLDGIARIDLVTTPELVGALGSRPFDAHAIDETTLLPAETAAALSSSLPAGRASWYMQQLIKLTYCLESSSRYVLVVDADTVFTRHQRFRTELGNTVIVQPVYHTPYFDHLGRLLPNSFRRPLFATTAHATVYDRLILEELIAEVEKVHHGRSWMEAICGLIDPTQSSGFSEGEFYGQWLVQRHPGEASVHRFDNIGVSRVAELPSTLDELAERFGDRYDSVSFHWYVDTLAA